MKVSAALLIYCIPDPVNADGTAQDHIRSADRLGLEVQEGFLVVTLDNTPVRLVPLAQVIWIEP